jgi:hypothetical protein
VRAALFSQTHKTDAMLDLLYTLRSVDGTANDNAPKCAWQDLPGSVKLDNEDRAVALTASYKHLLRRLQDGAPLVIETLDALAAAADKAGHSDAAREARVTNGWLRRLGGRDFTSTTWDSDYSRLDGFWACLRDTQMVLETPFPADNGLSQAFLLWIVTRYVNDMTPLQAEVDKIERSRTTLAQKVFRRLSGTVAALQRGAVVGDDDDFWNEESVSSATR